MKVLMTGGVIVMAPECADDHAAMHQMASEGITSMRLMDDDQTTEVHGDGLRGPLVIQTGGGRRPVAPATMAVEENNAAFTRKIAAQMHEDLCETAHRYGKKSIQYKMKLDHASKCLLLSLPEILAAFLSYSSSSPR